MRKFDPLRRSPGRGLAFLCDDKLFFLGLIDLPPFHAIESGEVTGFHFPTSTSKGAEENGETFTSEWGRLEAHGDVGCVLDGILFARCVIYSASSDGVLGETWGRSSFP